MKKIAILAGTLLFSGSFFANGAVAFVKADVLEDVVISYNNIASQVEALVVQEIPEMSDRLAAAERLSCMIMIERYKIKLLHIDDELEKDDYSEHRKKYCDLLKRLNNWKYGRS